MTLKIAFGSVPKDGGTFTFYRLLRPLLAKQSVDLRCVTVGKQEASLWNPDFADEGCVLLARDTANRKKQARVFVDWCVQEEVDMVFGVNSVAILSAIPHLPRHIRVLARCANAFDHGYRITVAGYPRLAKIVALAPKQVEDLVACYGVDRNRCALIPNGANPARFASASNNRRGRNPVLQLGFMGRLEHKQKGVLFLPDILAELERLGVDYHLHIAGQGVHERQLREGMKPFIEQGRVSFVGLLKPDEIPGFLAQTDVYLFPSLFEGSPNALLEAMMAGCIPAAWNIRGLIDFLLDHGKAGILAETGDCRALAEGIANVEKDRNALDQLSKTVSGRARQHYSDERVVADYLRLFTEVMSAPAPDWEPLPWSQFELTPAFAQPLWKRMVPEALKTSLKKSLAGWSRS